MIIYSIPQSPNFECCFTALRFSFPPEVPTSTTSCCSSTKKKTFLTGVLWQAQLDQFMFTTMFQSSVNTMWCQIKVTKSLALPYEAAALKNLATWLWECRYYGDTKKCANCPYVSEGILFIIVYEICLLEPQTFFIRTIILLLFDFFKK